MGYTKHLMELEEEQRGVAADILVQADVLRRCMIHAWITYHGGEEVVEAYKLAYARLRDRQKNYDHAMDCFEPHTRQMTDTIKEVYEQPYGTECPMCAKD